MIWCLQRVEICPLHKVPLETSCPACHRELRPVCAVSRPGFCSRCRQWLGIPRRSQEKLPPTHYQIWVAQQFGQLLAMARDAQPVGKEAIRKVLVPYVDSLSEGNRIAAAETAGCRRSSFYNWVQRSNDCADRPATPNVLRVEDPVDFLAHGSYRQTGRHRGRQASGRGKAPTGYRALAHCGSDSRGAPVSYEGTTGSQHS